MTRLHQLKEESTISSDVTERPNTNHAVSIDRTVLWRAILFNTPPPDATIETEHPKHRGRRNVHSKGHHNHHAQLKQVQNLGHRLYQL
ncbi:hypothetical protein M9458_009819, partial [Cirrhinus mrigala]